MEKPTTVVSVKVSQIRPQYQNLSQWMSNPDHIYIGRKGVVFVEGERFPKTDSIWANPFKVNSDDPNSRKECIRLYETYLRNRLSTEPGLLDELLKLKGKTLGCWCKPESCHGDILIKLIMEASFISG